MAEEMKARLTPSTKTTSHWSARGLCAWRSLFDGEDDLRSAHAKGPRLPWAYGDNEIVSRQRRGSPCRNDDGNRVTIPLKKATAPVLTRTSVKIYDANGRPR